METKQLPMRWKNVINGTVNRGYDWVGNRLDTGFTYNAADQLTASPGKSYTYDGNGNMLTGTMSFSYTYTNLVATAGNTSMGWDSMGNRVSSTTSGIVFRIDREELL